MKTHTAENENINTINETVYGWWMRHYEKKSSKCFGNCNYFATDVGNKDITFKEVFEGLKVERCIYDMCGIGDSEVRQVIMRHLCELYDIGYEIVHAIWIDGLKGLSENLPKWERFAKYRGKNRARLDKLLGKELHVCFHNDRTVDYIKNYYRGLVEDYKKIA